MGGPVDITFGRPSINGATRRVRVLIRLGDLADPEARQLHFYVKRAAVFPDGAEVLVSSARGRGDLVVLTRRLVGPQLPTRGVPRLYA